MPHTQQVFLAWHRMSLVFKAMSRQSLPSVYSLSWCDALAASPMLILQLGLVWKRWEMSKSPCQQTPVSLFSLGWSKSVHFFCCWKWKLSYMAVYSSDSPWCWGQPELKHGSPLWHALATNQEWSTHSADSFISSERLPGLCQLPWSSVMEACHLSVLGWRPIGKPFREIRQ